MSNSKMESRGVVLSNLNGMIDSIRKGEITADVIEMKNAILDEFDKVAKMDQVSGLYVVRQTGREYVKDWSAIEEILCNEEQVEFGHRSCKSTILYIREKFFIIKEDHTVHFSSAGELYEKVFESIDLNNELFFLIPGSLMISCDGFDDVCIFELRELDYLRKIKKAAEILDDIGSSRNLVFSKSDFSDPEVWCELCELQGVECSSSTVEIKTLIKREDNG